MEITLQLYDANLFESYEEAVSLNMHYTIVLYGAYSSLEDNNLLDVIRSACFVSKLGRTVVVVESKNVIIGVFHPGSKIPF
jgi:hypothetical protein